MATRRDRKAVRSRVVARAMRRLRIRGRDAIRPRLGRKAWHWPVVAVAGASLVRYAVWLGGASVVAHPAHSRPSGRGNAPAWPHQARRRARSEVGDPAPRRDSRAHLSSSSPFLRAEAEKLSRSRGEFSPRGGDGPQPGTGPAIASELRSMFFRRGVERGSPESLPGLFAGPGSATPKFAEQEEEFAGPCCSS